MRKINKQKALELIARGAVLVDLRSPVDFRDGSFPGAVNLPLKNFLNKIVGMNRKSKIVLFSTSINDSDLANAVNYSEQLGFGEVFITEYRQLMAPDVINDAA